MRRLSQQEAIDRMQKIKPNYDFSKFIYKDARSKSVIICDKGHEYMTSFDCIIHNINCPECSSNSKKIDKKTILNMLKQLEPKYDFSKFEYINSYTKSTIICDKGHEYKTTFNNFKSGRRCPICYKKNANKKRRLEPYIALKAMKEAEPYYNFDKFDYTNSRTNSIIICNKGHEFKTSYSNFVKKNSRCPHCVSHKSKPETEIIEFIKTFYDGYIEQSNRKIVPSRYNNSFMELDIYIPDLKFAIEFNGTYWHRDDKFIKLGWNSAKEYHNYKYNECFKRNIFLLHIEEIEWKKDKESILNKIKRILTCRII